MQTGWFTQDGEEYYLDPDTGVMARNTTMNGHEMNSSESRFLKKNKTNRAGGFWKDKSTRFLEYRRKRGWAFVLDFAKSLV